jgi:hypothetical protein
MRGRRDTAALPSGGRGPVYARAVGSYVPKLTRKAFEKFGFSTASLITDWAQVAGPQVAGCSVPERLKWPRTAAGQDEAGDERRAPATLILRVDPARALDVQYMAAQLVERVNRYFGYRAVADIRILQAPLAGHGERPELPAPVSAPPAKPRDIVSLDLSQIGDERLRAALERMRAGIASGR